MTRNATTWKPGQSGNPKGRPKKNRAWTEILEKAGSRTLDDVDGKRRARKRIIARLLVDLAATGEAVLPGGKRLFLEDVTELIAVCKFLYGQIDGPPRLGVDVEHSGELELDFDARDELVSRITGLVTRAAEADDIRRDND